MANHKFYKSTNNQNSMIPLNTYIWDKNYKMNYTRKKTFIYPYQYMCYLDDYDAQEGTSSGNVLCSFPIKAGTTGILPDEFVSYKDRFNKLEVDLQYSLIDSDGTVYHPGYYKPGYCPSFKKKLYEYSFIYGWGYLDTKVEISKGTQTLDFKYFIGDQEITTWNKSYSASDFPDGVLPSRVIIELVGGGGSGGSALWTVGGWGGNGGGGGGYICFVLNLDAAAGQWDVILPQPVAGGSGNSGNGRKGGDAIVRPHADSLAEYNVIAYGGNGGTGGGGSSFAKGGSSKINNNTGLPKYFTELESIDGANGGSQKGGHKGYNIDNTYDIACSSNIVNNTVHHDITHKQRGGTKGGSNTGTGQGTAGGGGASAIADGANAVVSGAGDNGTKGSGGAGGSYVAVYTPEGGYGGPCYFACYY